MNAPAEREMVEHWFDAADIACAGGPGFVVQVDAVDLLRLAELAREALRKRNGTGRLP